jgi:dihydroorotate dehydrogenase
LSLTLRLLHGLPPEAAHRITIAALRLGLAGAARDPSDPILQCRLWGRTFANPVGIAAGFDKHAEAVDPLLRLGFGSVEIGSVTPRAQPGNPKPRLFRLAADQAVINRMGFNSHGHGFAARGLMSHRSTAGPVGVNLGKNRDSDDALADYAAGIAALGHFADYLVVNISSPNTPGLRDLQGPARLRPLVEGLHKALADLAPPAPALLLKLAPDLTPAERREIATVVLEGGIDGLVVSNTTTARPPGLKSPAAREAGGLSGPPLFQPATAALGDFYRLTAGRLPLIGVGGVASGADAYAKIRAGASLVQLYTALVYQGPGLVGAIKRDLAALLRRDGFASVAAATGADHRSAAPG